MSQRSFEYNKKTIEGLLEALNELLGHNNTLGKLDANPGSYTWSYGNQVLEGYNDALENVEFLHGKIFTSEALLDSEDSLLVELEAAEAEEGKEQEGSDDGDAGDD